MGNGFQNVQAISFTPGANSFGLGFDNFNFSSASVPEPSALAIFALGIIDLASRRFKKPS